MMTILDKRYDDALCQHVISKIITYSSPGPGGSLVPSFVFAPWELNAPQFANEGSGHPSAHIVLGQVS